VTIDWDKVMPVVVLALAIYTWGCLNRGWTSPADVIRNTRHGMNNRRSEDSGVSDVVSGRDVGSGVGPTVRRESLSGPKPLNELYADRCAQLGRDPDGDEDDDPPPATADERREWVALRLRPDDPLNLTVTQIDRKGSELFGCSEKTIERDRQRITGRLNGQRR
jgi:hypothetical protein